MKTFAILLALSLSCAASPMHKPHWKPTPTPTPKPTVTPTPSATATPTASPTPITSFRQPHGFYELLGGDPGKNAAMQGGFMKVRWSDVAPTSTTYNWTNIDKFIAKLAASGKGVELALTMNTGGDIPTWVTAIGGVRVYKRATGDNFLLPSDPQSQMIMRSFIEAFCDKYDGKVDAIAMGGMGGTTETHMPDPVEISQGVDLQGAADAWEAACNTIIDTYLAHIKKSSAIMAAATPYNGSIGQTALKNVVNRACQLYPNFGLENWGLTERSDVSYVPNALILQYSPTHPVGFQTGGSVQGGGSGPIDLAKTIDAGVNLGAHYIQVYASDAEDAKNAPLFSGAKLIGGN